MFNQGGFAPNVWRIVCDCPTYTLQGIDVHEHEIRPPKPEELPALNWLAYGSSITNAHLDGYIHVAARKLRVQVQNKGFSGSCFCEKELVSHFECAGWQCNSRYGKTLWILMLSIVLMK